MAAPALRAVPDPDPDDDDGEVIHEGTPLQRAEAAARREHEAIKSGSSDMSDRLAAFIKAGSYGHLDPAYRKDVREYLAREFADRGEYLFLMTAASRPKLVGALNAAGLKPNEIADTLGLSRTRVARMLAGKTGNEARDEKRREKRKGTAQDDSETASAQQSLSAAGEKCASTRSGKPETPTAQGEPLGGGRTPTLPLVTQSERQPEPPSAITPESPATVGQIKDLVDIQQRAQLDRLEQIFTEAESVLASLGAEYRDRVLTAGRRVGAALMTFQQRTAPAPPSFTFADLVTQAADGLVPSMPGAAASATRCAASFEGPELR